MKWLIDIGNSCCKCAHYRDGAVTVRGSVETARIEQLQALLADGAAQSAWVASVAGEAVDRRVAALINDACGLDARFVQPQDFNCGIKTAYRSDQLGADRFVCLLGAWNRLHRSCIVADCGTAATVDYLDAAGLHRGGVIFPGLATAYDGLHHGTQRLPRPAPVADAGVFATATDAAISGGCRYMLSATVQAVAAAMRAEDDADAPLLLTGGLAETVGGQLDEAAAVVAALPLEGLAALSDIVEGR